MPWVVVDVSSQKELINRKNVRRSPYLKMIQKTQM